MIELDVSRRCHGGGDEMGCGWIQDVLERFSNEGRLASFLEKILHCFPLFVRCEGSLDSTYSAIPA